MFNIGSFFGKLTNSFQKEILIRTSISEAIEKSTGVLVPIEHISFSGSTVVLKNTNQTLRSVIYIKKEAILKEIREKQSLKVITDIR